MEVQHPPPSRGADAEWAISEKWHYGMALSHFVLTKEPVKLLGTRQVASKAGACWIASQPIGREGDDMPVLRASS